MDENGFVDCGCGPCVLLQLEKLRNSFNGHFSAPALVSSVLKDATFPKFSRDSVLMRYPLLFCRGYPFGEVLPPL